MKESCTVSLAPLRSNMECMRRIQSWHCKLSRVPHYAVLYLPEISKCLSIPPTSLLTTIFVGAAPAGTLPHAPARRPSWHLEVLRRDPACDNTCPPAQN